MKTVVENYHEDIVATFKNYKKLADRAFAQISAEDFFRAPAIGDNSIAVIVKHVAGNQRSRFTDFLTTDGEKSDRFRDSEFVIKKESREHLMIQWEKGWKTLLDTLESLDMSDFEKRITIRGEKHTVIEAINRQLTHYAYHIGQITFLAKHFKSSEWKSLSVPLNQSDEFNQFLLNRKDESKTHPLEGPMDFAAKKSQEAE
jgi:hypothetical protein